MIISLPVQTAVWPKRLLPELGGGIDHLSHVELDEKRDAVEKVLALVGVS